MRVHGHGGTHKPQGGGAPPVNDTPAPAPEQDHGKKHGKKHGSDSADRLSGNAQADFGNPPWSGDQDEAVQAFGDSCVATSLQRELRSKDPVAYRQQVDQLEATGQTTLANGTALSLAPDVLAEIQAKGLPKQLERSAVMQAAIMALAKDQGYGADGGGIKEGDVQALGAKVGVDLAMANGKLAVGQYVGISENGGYHLVKVVGAQKTHGKRRFTFADGSARETVMRKNRVSAMKRAESNDGVGTSGSAATTVSKGYRSR
ncbi:MAG: hypothetical protein JWM80_3666 [Cyanobacteria bacterium RYN_339]|nr:hypothetical protein [Cyanobacteria bacterium RYN_339]